MYSFVLDEIDIVAEVLNSEHGRLSTRLESSMMLLIFLQLGLWKDKSREITYKIKVKPSEG